MRLRFSLSFFLCSLELFLNSSTSFPWFFKVDIEEEQLKLFPSSHKLRLGAMVYWFWVTTPEKGTKNQCRRVLVSISHPCFIATEAFAIKICVDIYHLSKAPWKSNNELCLRIVSFCNQFLHSIKHELKMKNYFWKLRTCLEAHDWELTSEID